MVINPNLTTDVAVANFFIPGNAGEVLPYLFPAEPAANHVEPCDTQEGKVIDALSIAEKRAEESLEQGDWEKGLYWLRSALHMVLQKNKLDEEIRVRKELGFLLIDKGNSQALISEGLDILRGIQSPTGEVVRLRIWGLLKATNVNFLEIEAVDLNAPETREQELLLMKLRDMAVDTLFLLKSAKSLAGADLRLK